MITTVILIVTIAISLIGFNREQLRSQMVFNAYKIIRKSEYHRFITHAFIHSDWNHLIINMFVLYFFGTSCEQYLAYHLNQSSTPVFLGLYFGAIIFSSIYSFFKHKSNPYYNALGASGAVMAVVFTNIFFAPWSKIYFFGIVPIPGIIFGIIYLVYSFIEGKKQKDNIGHDAHIFGAIFGFLFPLIMDFSLLENFINQLTSILN